jgi:hypothetical protein
LRSTDEGQDDVIWHLPIGNVKAQLEALTVLRDVLADQAHGAHSSSASYTERILQALARNDSE